MTFRRAVAGLIAVGLVGVTLYSLDQLHRADQAQIKKLNERWNGSPAIWQPPPIANTDIVFYDVSGITQQELIGSLKSSKICDKYGPCAPDPAFPNPWALSGFKNDAGTYSCHAPSSTTLSFREFVVLPRWSPPADGSVKVPLVRAWNALAQVIYTHEAGHVAINQRYLADLNNQVHGLASCQAVNAFWSSPSLYDKLSADQKAYHARLRADCRPAIGCYFDGWMGW